MDTLKRGLSSGSQSDDTSLQIKKTENLPPSTSTSTSIVAAVVEVQKEDISWDTLKRGLSSRSQSDPSVQIKRTENQLPPSTSTTTSVAAVVEGKIEIHVKSEGEIEEERIYKVPLKYLSYTTFRGLMERSGEDLNNISGGQKINISCEFELFERISKLIKRKELEAKYENSSYDDRLWKRN